MTMTDIDVCICNNAPKSIAIQKIVCDSLNLDMEFVRSNTHRRNGDLIIQRHFSMHLNYKYYGKDGISKIKKSNNEIGLDVDGKDHASVIHARKTIKNRCDTDVRFSKKMNEIEKNVVRIKAPEFYSYLRNKCDDVCESYDGYTVRLIEFDFIDKSKWKCEVLETRNIIYRADCTLKKAYYVQENKVSQLP